MKKRRAPKALRIVSNSERGTSACWRRWWWGYHLGFSSFDSPAPLRQGSLMHRMLAAWYLSGMQMTAVDLARDVADVWLAERTEYAGKSLPLDIAGERIVEDMQIHNETVAIVAHYILHYGDQDRARWEVLAVEAAFARGVPHPRTGKPITSTTTVDGKRVTKTWVHAGQADLLVRDRETGSLWYVEHKSTTEDNFDGFFRKLHLDNQTRGYAWALRDPIYIGGEGSIIVEPQLVAGVIYNAIRKTVPRVPPLLKGRATKANPNPPSPGLSRAKIDTTRDVYLATILANGFDPGEYADILADLERKRFFGREQYSITEAELDRWIVDHARWVLEAKRMSQLPVEEPPPRQVTLCMEWHRPCQFVSLCVEDGTEARRSYRVKTIRHEELPGALSEPSALQDRKRLGVVTEDGRKVLTDPVDRLMAGYAATKGLPDPFADL